jgi:hypothetical protein
MDSSRRTNCDLAVVPSIVAVAKAGSRAIARVATCRSVKSPKLKSVFLSIRGYPPLDFLTRRD